MSRPYYKRTRSVAAPLALTSSVEQHTGQKSVTLRGREFIQDVVVNWNAYPANGTGLSSLYSTQSIKITPTDSGLFSWLCSIADKFEEYKFYALAFTYEPQCNTATSGCVGVYFDPDPTNTPPASWQTFTNTGCNSHGAVWAKHQLLVPRSYYADRKQYYVSDQFQDAGGAPQVIDPLEYFPGTVGISTVGVTGNQGSYVTVGKLYLDYVITLQKATLDTTPRTAQFGNLNLIGKGNDQAAPVVSSGIAPTGKLVSPYFAQNSGTGCCLFFNNLTYTPLFGVDGATGAVNTGNVNGSPLFPSVWGDAYFSWTASQSKTANSPAISGVMIKQTVDLCYSIALDGVGTNSSGVILKWLFQNAQGQPSSLSTFNQSYSKSAAASYTVCFGTMHCVAGEFISLTADTTKSVTGTLVPANCKFFLTPCTWGIDQ